MAKKEKPESPPSSKIDEITSALNVNLQIGRSRGGCCGGGGCGRIPVDQLIDILDNVEKQQPKNS